MPNSAQHFASPRGNRKIRAGFPVFRAENAKFHAAFHFFCAAFQIFHAGNRKIRAAFPVFRAENAKFHAAFHFFCAAFQIFRAENTKCRLAETEFVPSAGRGEMTTARTWTKYTNSPRNCDLRSHSSESSLRKFLASAAMNANCLWRVTENSRLSFRANCSTFDTYLPAICESEHRRACSPTREK